MRIGLWYRKNWAWTGLVVLAALVAVIGLDVQMAAQDGPPPPRAEERANDPHSVLPLCAAFPNAPADQIGLCAGYLKAVAHVLANTAIDGQRACIPRTTTLGDLRDVVVRFTLEHPQLMQQMNTEALVARAMAQAFPCH